MTSSGIEGTPRPARISRSPREVLVRLVAAVGDRDDELVASLRVEGFAVEVVSPEALDRAAATRAAEALLVDAELDGALAAVGRIRKDEGVISTVPIVLISAAGGPLRTSLDAVDAGGDAFVPRPVRADDLIARLRSLLEVPGQETASVPPPRDSGPQAAPLPPSLAPPPIVGGDGTPAPTAAGLSPALADVLRSAAVRAGGAESDLVLPSLDDDAIDELIPAELLEPLDAPLDAVGEDHTPGTQHTPPPYAVGSGGRRTPSSRGMPAVNVRGGAPTPTMTPLAVGGEMRLTGSLGAHGAGVVLGAAWRSRASGVIVIRAATGEYVLSVMSGHLLSLRSNRSEDEAGALLVRLGAIPREAARFAAVPLDAGLRGAGLLAARGYITADALAQALGRAAKELAFDLLALANIEWEMRPLENAVEIPLAPRSLDALLVLGARARIEPDEAVAALGGPEATLSGRLEPATLAALPLTRNERESAGAVRSNGLAGLIESYGVDTAPALLALAWIGALRVEGGTSAALAGGVAALAHERTRARALVEAAAARDYFAMLGLSEWSTRAAAREALDARRAEIAGLRSRHGDMAELETVAIALDDLASLLDDADAWTRYSAAVRARSR
jgi:CheY-like chemotaxis protein